MTTHKLIIGCGYLGKRVARHYLQTGDSICGVVRSAASAEALNAAGIPALSWDLDLAGRQPLQLQDAELFYFAPPPRAGVEETRIKHLLSVLDRTNSPKRIVYLSTTGVYGDCHGEWVDEERPVHPVADRARRRWDGEQQFRAWSQATGGELIILRVAGIYGPDKLPLARLKRQEPMVKESEAPYTNRIHITDLVQVCLAAMARGGNGEIYNVSDGTPGNMTDYFNQVADWAGLPRPVQISLQAAGSQLSSGMLSYLQESRRLDSSKLQRELGVALAYPDLRSGLQACRSEN
ncbi:MAG: SDR family oxidoreductase [Sedimenticola sp.]|uniref:SDR family oxidoreductase n=1 Tax=Sedimenticola thiotaurini TaxID=1543721 RepID=A0A558DFP9_9GAMM|nr:SDR family oxidoreductase [Sedimenticola sp.]TVT59812.1 MAG: SDR family oxidoreductase [Sedimenticola thiotaurini]